MAVRISNPIHQHFTKGSITRTPLSRGQLFFYEPGTTTKKTVYSDQDATVAYSDNPVALDDDGFEPDIWGEGSYRVILKSSVETNSRIQFDEPLSFSSDQDAFGPWLETKTYGAAGENIVTGSDDKYYISIQASNINQDPAAGAAPTYWTEFDLLKQYNANETYATDDPITHGGIFYTSLADSNTGNTPASSPTKWKSTIFTVTVQVFTASGTWTKPSGVNRVIVEVIGSGGGGGGVAGGDAGSGGGGGGGYARAVLNTSLLTSETVTIGAGGAGGAGGSNNGSNGATSSFATLCVATGGSGGETSFISGGGGTSPALGGIGTTGDILISGESGAGNKARNNDAAAGGGTMLGAGGAIKPTSGTGLAGRNFGGGGAGGNGGSQAGGAGADGIVIVTEFRGE